MSTTNQPTTVPGCEPLTSILDALVASERAWRPIERLDVPAGRVMSLVVAEAARSHLGTLSAAVRHLDDPAIWAALQCAGMTAFPNDPGRRLPPTPPTRHRHYMIRQRLHRRDHRPMEARRPLRGGRCCAAHRALRSRTRDLDPP